MRLAILLLCLPGVAWADPIVIGSFLANAAFTAGVISTTTFLVITAATIVVGSAQARRARRNAEANARAAFNASLQDRQVMIRSAIAARPVIYGRAMISGPIVFAHSSGTRGEFLHLVVALAGHQCDAIEGVYFNETLLPAPDGAGLIQSGPFARINTIAQVFSGTGTSLNVGQTIAAVQSVTRTRGSGDAAETTTLALTSGFTFTGTTVSIVDGLNQTGDFYVVNYTWTQVLPRVRIRTFLGGAGQTASSELIAESGGRWTSSHIGTGICYLYVRLEYDQEVFGQVGVPNIKALVRGKRVFDPRTSTTAWSTNTALCTRDYLLDTVHGLGAAAGEVPDAEVIAAANVCDEEVVLYTTGTVAVTNGSTTVTGTGTAWASRARPGMFFRGPDGVSRVIASVASDTSLALVSNYTGTTTSGAAYSLRQTRYTCNGVLGTDTSARDNLEDLVGAMAGSAVWVQGRWLVRAGASRATEFTITEDFLAEGDIAIQARAPRSQLFNAVSGSFIDPANQYAEASFPSVENTTYQTQDGGQRISREVSWPLTNDATACQRLGKILLERARQALTIQVTCNLRAYDLVPSDWVALTLSRYGWTGKVFEVIGRSWTPGGAIRYTLRETAAAVYDWALGEQTAVDLAPNTQLPSPFALPALLTGLTVTSGTAALTQPFVGRVQVNWTQSTDAFVVQGGRIEVEWKLDDATVWTAEPPVIGAGTSTSFGPVDRRRVLLVRARAVNSFDRAGPWAYALHVVSASTTLGGGNLVNNGSFESDSNADGRADSWAAYSNGSTGAVTYVIDTSDSVHGTRSQRVTAAALGSALTDQAGVVQTITGNFGGRSFVWSCHAAAGAGVRLNLQMAWYTAANVLIRGSDVASLTSTSLWQRLSVADVAPTNAARVDVFVWQSRGTGASNIMLIDAAQLEQGNVLTAFAPRADELLPGVVGTTELAPEAATVVLSTSDGTTRTVGRGSSTDLTLTFTPTTSDPIVLTGFIDATMQGGWSGDIGNVGFIDVAPASNWTLSAPWWDITGGGRVRVATWDRNPNPNSATMSGVFTPVAGTTYRVGIGVTQAIIGNDRTIYNRSLRLEHIKR